MAGPLYGGQAVLEGVMMRGQRHVAVAVRHPKGHVVTRAEALPRRLREGAASRLPFVRGIAMLWDAMALGYRALAFSSQVAVSEIKGEEAPDELPAASSVRGTMVFSVVVASGLFFVAPMLIAGVWHDALGSAALTNLVEGVLRLMLMLGYLLLIGITPRVGRIFAYHGAEHKAVHAQEQGIALAPASLRACSTAHPRCGTALLLVVVVVSVIVFGLLGHPPLWARVVSRVLLIPVIVGLSYEWLRFSARHYRQWLVRALVWPGLWLQSLTTREPDDDQAAVAIAALQAVMAADERAQSPSETRQATPAAAVESA